MTQDVIIEIIIELVLFTTICYFVFYKSYLNALGKEMAKLSTAEKLTTTTESVKLDFKEKIEEFRSNLYHDLSSKIELLKSDLSKNNISHQIEYSFLHQERAKVTLELYKKLQELQSSMINWTAQLHPIISDAEKEREERALRANNALVDLRDFYIPNKVFFPKSFCASIDKLLAEYWDKGWAYAYKQNHLREGSLPKEFKVSYIKELSKISTEIKENLPPQISEIEDRIRQMLAVDIE